MIVNIAPGKQVTLSADMHLKIYANKGSLGVDLTPEAAEELGLALWRMGRKGKR